MGPWWKSALHLTLLLIPSLFYTLQITRNGGHSLAGTVWAWLLNALNLADAGLHVLYMALFALQLF